MTGHPTLRAVVMLIGVGVVVGAGLAVWSFLRGPAGPEGGTVSVEVSEGTGAGDVAAMLEERGVIASAFLFRLRARFDDRASRIRPGTYQLRRGMTADDILALLSAAPSEAPSFRVTIPEGLTVDQTLRRIADAEGSPFTTRQLRRALVGVALPKWVPADLPEQAVAFEGLLFPDTYDFRVDAEPQEVVARLVERTQEILDTVEPPAGVDPYELLIVGSLIEREARLREEQPIIASVIYNRLEQGIPLQIDATVIYALGEDRNRVLTSDLQVDSPWNTYQVQGLPPTPISGSGASALQAAASPDSTDFLFYVVSDPDTGAHAFAETLEEHNRNVAEYRAQRDEG